MKKLAGDASFRSYSRVYTDQGSYILMDAPLGKESLGPFVAIAKSFLKLGVCVPDIIAEDDEQGFLLLSDLGDCLYLGILNSLTAPALYHQAFEALLKIQQCKAVEAYDLPIFNESLYRQEVHLFRDWYLNKHQQRQLSQKDIDILNRIDDVLIEDALAQPQVCVHRDYHSRNLLLLDQGGVGVIDFQDAVVGPVTYDVMSLLRDCYIEWPIEKVRSWALQFQQLALAKGVLQEDNPEKFLKWFDWIALQRHLKCIGIFARLHERDNKSVYLEDIPRVKRYAKYVCNQYQEFSGLLPYLN